MKTNLPIFNFCPIAGTMLMNNLRVRKEYKMKLFLWGLLCVIWTSYLTVRLYKKKKSEK